MSTCRDTRDRGQLQVCPPPETHGTEDGSECVHVQRHTGQGPAARLRGAAARVSGTWQKRDVSASTIRSDTHVTSDRSERGLVYAKDQHANVHQAESWFLTGAHEHDASLHWILPLKSGSKASAEHLSICLGRSISLREKNQ